MDRANTRAGLNPPLQTIGTETVCLVLNNGCWGAEKAYQRDFFGGRYIGADVPNPPYDKVAQLFGAKGYRVDRVRDIEHVVGDALKCGKPAVVDIQVDPNALFSFRAIHLNTEPGAVRASPG
jgi:acetolactate synthase-1/2/3 large subunit/sulfoacetaldehyde acetyltransferase